MSWGCGSGKRELLFNRDLICEAVSNWSAYFQVVCFIPVIYSPTVTFIIPLALICFQICRLQARKKFEKSLKTVKG